MNIDRIKPRLGSEPSVRDLDVSVWDLLQEFAAVDMSEAEVVAKYSGLEHDDLLAAICYAVLVGRTAGIGARMREMRADIKSELKKIK